MFILTRVIFVELKGLNEKLDSRLRSAMIAKLTTCEKELTASLVCLESDDTVDDFFTL